MKVVQLSVKLGMMADFENWSCGVAIDKTNVNERLHPYFAAEFCKWCSKSKLKFI